MTTQINALFNFETQKGMSTNNGSSNNGFLHRVAPTENDKNYKLKKKTFFLNYHVFKIPSNFPNTSTICVSRAQF